MEFKFFTLQERNVLTAVQQTVEMEEYVLIPTNASVQRIILEIHVTQPSVSI